jgi:hypothetical protein
MAVELVIGPHGWPRREPDATKMAQLERAWHLIGSELMNEVHGDRHMLWGWWKFEMGGTGKEIYDGRPCPICDEVEHD